MNTLNHRISKYVDAKTVLFVSSRRSSAIGGTIYASRYQCVVPMIEKMHPYEIAAQTWEKAAKIADEAEKMGHGAVASRYLKERFKNMARDCRRMAPDLKQINSVVDEYGDAQLEMHLAYERP